MFPASPRPPRKKRSKNIKKDQKKITAESWLQGPSSYSLNQKSKKQQKNITEKRSKQDHPYFGKMVGNFKKGHQISKKIKKDQKRSKKDHGRILASRPFFLYFKPEEQKRSKKDHGKKIKKRSPIFWENGWKFPKRSPNKWFDLFFKLVTIF